MFGKKTSCDCKALYLKHLNFVILSLGIMMGGFFPGYYYYKAKTGANSVVVKGLAEQDVKADLAIWNIKFVVTGNDLQTAVNKVEKQINTIKDFLAKNNILENEINVNVLQTNDLTANPYHNSNDNPIRFILTQEIVVKSVNVDNIAKTLNKSAELVNKGIIFNQEYGSPVTYLFTKLNDIKPQMLAIATKNAKKAAEEFAQNSGSRVGNIRHANQGTFSILPSEQSLGASESYQINKKVRVVSTVEYWLK